MKPKNGNPIVIEPCDEFFAAGLAVLAIAVVSSYSKVKLANMDRTF